MSRTSTGGVREIPICRYCRSSPLRVISNPLAERIRAGHPRNGLAQERHPGRRFEGSPGKDISLSSSASARYLGSPQQLTETMVTAASLFSNPESDGLEGLSMIERNDFPTNVTNGSDPRLIMTRRPHQSIVGHAPGTSLLSHILSIRCRQSPDRRDRLKYSLVGRDSRCGKPLISTLLVLKYDPGGPHPGRTRWSPSCRSAASLVPR